MDKELVEITTKQDIKIVDSEVAETEIIVEESEQDVAAEVVTEAIEVELAEEIVIDVEDAVGWTGGDIQSHYSLTGRSDADQHPIAAITGLRAELDKIEKLKTVYADKIGMANFYKWNDGAYDEFGYFVSLVPYTSTITICDGEDIFGVTVDGTMVGGFVGGQNNEIPRDNTYAIVTTSGLVDVRCESDVEAGSYVVSNAYGVATKTNSGCGYKVIAVEEKNGVTYAVIVLGVQACMTNSMGQKIQYLSERMDDAETNIVSAINVANQAYDKVSEVILFNQQTSDKVDDALVVVDKVTSDMENLEYQVSNSVLILEQTRAVAETAATSAESMRNEAVEKANEALAETSILRDEFNDTVEKMNMDLDNTVLDIEALKEDLQPLVVWPEDSGIENTTGIAGFVARANEDSATLASIVTWRGDAGESLAGFVQEATDNHATVSAITSYQRKGVDGNIIEPSGAAGLIAQVETNKSAIELLSKLEDDNSESLAGLIAETEANSATVKILAERVDGNDEAIADIHIKTNENSSSIDNLTSWQSDTNISMTRIEQKTDANGAYIDSTVSNMDKYSVGPSSQSNGFTLEQAKNVLTNDMIYVPTETHTETSPISRAFTKQYYYMWDGEKWVTSDSVAVAFFDSYVVGNTNSLYWYIPGDSDVINENVTYNSHTLYKWESYVDENSTTQYHWVAVATLEGNAFNRAVSQIRQDANSVIAEVTNARGSAATLSVKLSETDATVNTVASWKTNVENDVSKISTIEQKANDNQASIGLVVKDGEVNGSVVVDAINGTTGVTIEADHINLDGYVTMTNLSTNGETVINGGNIQTGILNANNYTYTSGMFADSGMGIDLDNGVLRSVNFTIDNDGNAWLNGDFSAFGATIGGWNISTDRIWHYDKNNSIGAILYSPNIGTTDNVLAIGTFADSGENWDNAEFRVTGDGCLHATGANITGTINATKGYVGGEDGWIITEEYLASTARSVYLFGGEDGTARESSPIATNYGSKITNLVFRVGQNTTAPFGIGADGKLYASDAYISGTINATSGSFTGSIGTGGKIILDQWDSSGNGRIRCQTQTGGVYNSFITLGDTGNLIIKGNYLQLESSVQDGHLIGTWIGSVGSATSSDVNLKNSIEVLPSEYENIIDYLRPVRYKYNDGTSNRYHTGFIAQEVSEALNASNVASKDFAGLVISNQGGTDEMWALRYEEFIALNTAAIQKLKTRITELENVVIKLQEKEE